MTPKFTPEDIDYSLYLVTGRELLPPGKDYYESLEESLRGGVTVVQVREKNIDSGEFYEIARKTKLLTDAYNVPLIINDRLDICLSVGAAGLHIGQTDLDPRTARNLLPPGSVLGLSIGSLEEASRLLDLYKRSKEGEGEKEEGEKALVDYVGIGAVWRTTSKDVSKKVMLGPEGVGEILDVLHDGSGGLIRSVAIGGIHLPNLPHLLHGSRSPIHLRTLDGIAVISDIVSSPHPEEAARQLSEAFKRGIAGLSSSGGRGGHAVLPTGIHRADRQGDGGRRRSKIDWLEGVVGLMKVVKEKKPLAHQMTNTVVANDSANATLALGGSPIMATHPLDVKDLSKILDALLINFGTISDKQGMIVAGQEANKNLKPVIFDPVAIGATSYRRETAKELLDAWQPTVIKGNAGEIGALAGSLEVASKGVDSVGPGFANPADVVKTLARQKRAIVAMTGVDDYISDGETVLKVSNGHHWMGCITGSGCMTGTAVTVYCGAARIAGTSSTQLVKGDMLLGVLAGILVYTIAGQKAGARDDVRGPGTFRAAFIDEMYHVTTEDVLWMAKFEIVE